MKKASGTPFTASEAFYKGINGFHETLTMTRGDTGVTFEKPERAASFGPIYQDIATGYGWMWEDHSRPDLNRKGTIFGIGQAVTNYEWLWFGRTCTEAGCTGHCFVITVPTSVPTVVSTAVPTAVSTVTSTFAFKCDESSFEVPFDSGVESASCYPIAYIVGYDKPNDACLFNFENASVASGAIINVPFSGTGSCGNEGGVVEGVESHTSKIFIRHQGCREMNREEVITCEYNTLVDKSAKPQAPEIKQLNRTVGASYDVDVEVLSDWMNGTPLTANDKIADATPLYLNVT